MSLTVDLELFVHHLDDRTIWGSTGLRILRGDNADLMAGRISEAVARLDVALYGRIPTSRRRWTPRLAARRPCGACHRPLVFASTTNGNVMPLDPDPTPTGNIHYIDSTFVNVTTGLLLEAARNTGELLFVSHFATCPEAARYRKKPPKNRRTR